MTGSCQRNQRSANMIRMAQTPTRARDPSWMTANSMGQPPWVAIITTVLGGCLRYSLPISMLFAQNQIRICVVHASNSTLFVVVLAK